jgi:hypothetical protein
MIFSIMANADTLHISHCHLRGKYLNAMMIEIIIFVSEIIHLAELNSLPGMI